MSTPQMSYVNENSQSNMKEQRQGNNNTSDNLFVVFTSVYVNVRDGCMWSLARWVMLVAGMIAL